MTKKFIPLAALAVFTLATSACTSDSKAAQTTAPANQVTTAASTTATAAGVTADGISQDRCDQNKKAGKLTYLTSFDFSASVSILDVIVAKDKGFFDKMCLNVDIKPGQAPANEQQVASGAAQFSSGGSFGEIVNTNVQSNTNIVALVQYGKTAIEELLVKPESGIKQITDLKGKTMGVKGDIPYSIQTMLGKFGVKRSNIKELALNTYDPVEHFGLALDALPVYKSNEPAKLDAKGIKYVVFNPLDYDIPSSFGMLYTSKSFLNDHPSAAQDFARAAIHGFEYAQEHPEEAVKLSVDRINANGNKAYLSLEGETFRWQTESKIVKDSTPKDQPIGAIDTGKAEAEIDALTKAGVFKTKPEIASMIAPGVVEGIYDHLVLIWPNK